MKFNIQTQKEIIRKLSNKVVNYANEGTQIENTEKPYYLYRLTGKNEFKEYLIGFTLTLSQYPGAKLKSNCERVLGYERAKSLITRSKRQINEGELSGHLSTIHIPMPLLGEKVNGKWEIYLKEDTQLSTASLSICKVEGEVYLDTVWLQSEDKDYALELLIKNKINAVAKMQKQIDSQNEKINILETVLHESKRKAKEK